MGMGFLQQKSIKSEVPIKLAQPFRAPELRAKNYGDEAFLTQSLLIVVSAERCLRLQIRPPFED